MNWNDKRDETNFNNDYFDFFFIENRRCTRVFIRNVTSYCLHTVAGWCECRSEHTMHKYVYILIKNLIILPLSRPIIISSKTEVRNTTAQISMTGYIDKRAKTDGDKIAKMHFSLEYHIGQISNIKYSYN